MKDFSAWLPVLLNLIVAAFIYGGLTQRVKGLESDAEESSDDRKQIWTAVGKHGERISRMEGQGRANGAAAGR